MKTQTSQRRAWTPRPLSILVWSASVTALTMLLCVGMWTVLPRSADDPRTKRRLPTGQVHADARTLLAAFKFLLDDDSNPVVPGTAVTCSPANLALLPCAAPTVFGCVSNQADLLFEPATNLPARS
jgi:hypothetical protein